jgi:hypothetical protein
MIPHVLAARYVVAAAIETRSAGAVEDHAHQLPARLRMKEDDSADRLAPTCSAG